MDRARSVWKTNPTFDRPAAASAGLIFCLYTWHNHTMEKIKISLANARRMVLHSLLLDGCTKLSPGKEGAAQIIDKLGYIQIDPMSAIKRTHHHTLWTRKPDYQEEMLYKLQATDRRVFEYWTHALAYLPMADYRYSLPRMQNFYTSKDKFVQWHLEKSQGRLESVLECIRREGPQNLKDLYAKLGTETKASGSKSEAIKFSLSVLFWRGEIMVTQRLNSEKTYDLPERVLPDSLDTSYPSEEELGRHLICRALSALGTAQEKDICTYMQPGSARDAVFAAAGKAVIATSLKNLVDEGTVIPVSIPDDSRSPYYAMAEILENIPTQAPTLLQVYLLSPFDNLITNRERTQRLFGFDYKLECYVPATKRKFGYYVLPILWGDKLVGRCDPKADRKRNTLLIQNLMFEPDFKLNEDFLPLLADKLAAMAQFNACETIELKEIIPEKIRTPLNKLLGSRVQ